MYGVTATLLQVPRSIRSGGYARAQAHAGDKGLHAPFDGKQDATRRLTRQHFNLTAGSEKLGRYRMTARGTSRSGSNAHNLGNPVLTKVHGVGESPTPPSI